jgi:hypothetical protein
MKSSAMRASGAHAGEAQVHFTVVGHVLELYATRAHGFTCRHRVGG